MKKVHFSVFYKKKLEIFEIMEIACNNNSGKY